MAKKNKLSVYLIKHDFSETDTRMLKQAYKSVHIMNVGELYYEPSYAKMPAWMNSFFQGQVNVKELFTSNTKALLISRIELEDKSIRAFAIAFGYGKNMLLDGVIEEDFGLKVVLNTITAESLRKINKVNIGGNQKISQEQMPLESNIDGFQFDIDRDLIGAITGRSEEEGFITGLLTGTDMLSLTADVNIKNLDIFLRKVYSKYISKSYKDRFGWVDNIRRVKSKQDINILNEVLFQLIKNKSPKVRMAVPEVIDWENVKGFKYCGKELLNDIDISDVIRSFQEGFCSIEQLKSKTISAIREDNEEPYISWKAYKCIYAEVDYGNSVYCLNNGKWFCVDNDFVNTINNYYMNMPITDMPFVPHSIAHNKENDYTKALVESDKKYFLLMDAKTISYGGGHSKIELCDALTVDGKFVHIKKYSASSVLSHLFNQALVSAELIIEDSEFLVNANKRIRELTDDERFLLGNEMIPTVILAIISKTDNERPEIPFFSKIALRHTYQRLTSYGCKVYIKNIKENEVS